MGRNKPKFDKHKCLKCVYHGNCGAGWHIVDGHGEGANVICNYATITGFTCLKRVARDELKDIRGEDFNNCKLYTEGKSLGKKLKGVVFE